MPKHTYPTMNTINQEVPQMRKKTVLIKIRLNKFVHRVVTERKKGNAVGQYVRINGFNQKLRKEKTQPFSGLKYYDLTD